MARTSPQPKKNSPEEKAAALAWLDSASQELGLDPHLARTSLGDLLALTSDVAHGPSRAAAPITTFLVGVAAGLSASSTSPDDLPAHVVANIDRVRSLLERTEK
ncbi:DUF6457 domain-containing protein [Corynebacterium endometrii]|uniref:DUF6457 domain-containing protein n=1 Tax=Corynebacterium endometrii TaxID=2488819 RepID=A0A4P7QEE7_9CORY|nr:DUF6457 domain-containing protein [Corynebacterium endometrii]QCB27710.1 hypothetical protein CENDO_02060 [Corynebacterium endometrii]